MTYRESERGHAGYTTEGTTGLPAGGEMDFVDYGAADRGADEALFLSFERWAPDMPWEVSTGTSVLTGELTIYPAPPLRHRRRPVPLHQLVVSPADVTGAGLGLALNTPAPPPLATSRLHHPDGGALLLGALGASHVVTVEHPTCLFSEQVSRAARDALPERTDAPGYHLESRTETYDQATFRRLAHRLRERCARETGWLGGAFPGDDAALTALAAEPDGAGWRWQTWHLYPAAPGGTIVYTASRWHP